MLLGAGLVGAARGPVGAQGDFPLRLVSRSVVGLKTTAHAEMPLPELLLGVVCYPFF